MPLDGFELFKNSAFSEKNPLLQVYIDSTSLTEFKICPRKYYYSIVYGFQPASESVHLTFGIMLHRAVELYWTYRLEHQMYHRDAMMQTVKDIMTATWDKQTNRGWYSDHAAYKIKNRYTLIRTIVWYMDKYQNDPIKTVRVGKSERLAVELPFRLNTRYKSATTGDDYVLCGRLDRIGELNGVHHVTDVKSTGRSIGEYFFAQFTPHNQFTIYTIAARSVFNVDTSGVLVDACQVVQSFSEFQRGLVTRSDAQLEEWHKDLGYHLERLEDCAYNDNWPMNDSACGMYGGCPFQKVCAAPSNTARRQLLKSEYKRRVWDPTFERLDY